MHQEQKGDAKGTQGVETKVTPAATELWNVQKYLKALEEKSLTTLDLSHVRVHSNEGPARVIKTFEGHIDLVTSLTVLPDNRVVSGSEDKTLKVWDVKQGKCVATWVGHKRGVSALAVLPDGRVVSGSFDSTLKVWDVKQGKCVATWVGHKGGLSALAVLPDGRVVSGSLDNTLKVWDVKRGECIATWMGHKGIVFALAVLPDGRVVSGSEDNTLKVWDVKSGACVATWEDHQDIVTAVAILPDGRVLSGSQDDTLKVWDVKRGECVETWEGDGSGVFAVAVFPDDRVVSGSFDSTLKIWDVKRGECVAIWEGHKSEICAVAVLPDGHVVSGSRDNTVKVWERPTRDLLLEDLAPLFTQLKTDRILTALNLSQQKKLDDKALPLLLEALSSNKTLRHLDLRETGISFAGIKMLYEALKGHPLREGLLHEGIAKLVKSETLVASVEKTASKEVKALSRIEHKGDAKGTQGIETKATPVATELWDVQKYLKALEEKSLTTLDLSHVRIPFNEGQGRAIKTFEGHSRLATALTVLRDNRVVSASIDNTLKVWDLKSGECVATWEGHKGSVYAVAVLPDGRVVSGSKDKTLKGWDVENGECVATWMGHKSGVSALAVLPDGRVVSGSEDNTLKVWDVKSGACVATWEGHKNSVMAVAVLPDGCVVSGSGDKTLKIWDVKRGECVATWVGHEGIVTAVGVLLDGRVVSGSWDNTLKVWDVKQGKCVATWKEHTDTVTAVSVLLDGRVVSGSWDNTLKVWDVKRGECVATWEGHKDRVYAVAVLQDAHVVSVSYDNTLKVWERPTRGLLLEDLAPLLTQLKTDRILTALNLSQQKELDDKTVALLLEALSSNKTLRHLDLRETGISFTGIKMLYESLKGHPLREGLLHEGIAELVKAETLVASVEKRALAEAQEVKALSRIEHKGDPKGTQDIETKATPVATELWDVQKYLKALEEKSLTTLDLSHVRVQSNKGLARAIKTFEGHSGLHALTVLPDNRIVSGSKDNTLKIWDVKRDECVAIWKGHNDRVTAVAVLSDGRVISGSWDCTLKIWDMKRGECVTTWKGHKSSVHVVAVLPDGRVVSGSADRTLKLWDVKRGECVATWEGHKGTVYGLAVLPDGRVVSGSYDKTLKVWDVKSGACVATWEGHESSVMAVAVLPDGRVVSGSEDNTLKVWDVKQGECVATWEGYQGGVSAIAVLPDGRVMSGSFDKTLKIWDVRRHECIAIWVGHNRNVSALAVLPDGRIVSGSYDNTLKVWELPNRGLLLGELVPLLTQLKTDRTLTALNLSQQRELDDKATLPLLEVLSQNTTLTELDIRGTGISATSARLLYEVLKARSIQKRIHHEALPSIKLDVHQHAFMPENKGESKIEKKVDSSTETKGDQKTSSTISYTLNYNDLTLDPEIIGHGGYGDVYKATWRREDGAHIVAVKQLRLSKFSEKAMEEFKKESELMASFKSDYIIKFYGYCVSPRCCITMQYMPKGSLFDLINSGQTLTWPMRARIAIDIAQGLKYLHDNHVLHRDLKSLNVLLDEHFCARLCDFGLSKIKSESMQSTTQASARGTAAWMAPELADFDGIFTKKSDIYSMGMILWELAANKLPFAHIVEDYKRMYIPRWVAEGKIKETIPPDCPKKMASLIRFCWEIKPDNRPTAAQAVEYLESDKEDYAEFASALKSRKLT